MSVVGLEVFLRRLCRKSMTLEKDVFYSTTFMMYLDTVFEEKLRLSMTLRDIHAVHRLARSRILAETQLFLPH